MGVDVQWTGSFFLLLQDVSAAADTRVRKVRLGSWSCVSSLQWASVTSGRWVGDRGLPVPSRRMEGPTSTTTFPCGPTTVVPRNASATSTPGPTVIV